VINDLDERKELDHKFKLKKKIQSVVNAASWATVNITTLKGLVD